jgi:hypothetical protein
MNEPMSGVGQPGFLSLSRCLPRQRLIPLPDLPELRPSADVLEITGDDLRFSVLGGRGALRDGARSPAGPRDRRTAGWAAGLTLFHLATLHHTAAQRRRSVDEPAARACSVTTSPAPC